MKGLKNRENMEKTREIANKLLALKTLKPPLSH